MSTLLQLVDLSAHLAYPSEAEIELGRLFGRDESLVIFDIGACEGEDSIRYARRYPRARVYGFEPLPDNQALFRQHLAAHASLRVQLVPLALSDRTGTATFHVSSGRPPTLFAGEAWNYGNKSSSLLAPATSAPMHGWIEFRETISVPTQTLDAFCATEGIDHIDFIQMDVQGAEQLVLAGAARMMPRITAVWLEVARKENYRGQPLAADLQRFMRTRGFRLCFETYRGDDSSEGDHLYLNLRHPRTWGYAATRRLRALAGRVKRTVLA